MRGYEVLLAVSVLGMVASLAIDKATQPEPRDDLSECRARLAVYREPDAGPPVEQCFNVRCNPNSNDAWAQPWQRVCVEGRR